MNAWWQGLASAQAWVECGGQRHRLRWEAGVLHALDHGDAEGERALAALGGETCACLDLLEAWERHRDDLRVLVLGSRGPTDILAAREDPAAQLAGGSFGGRPQAVRAGRAAARGPLLRASMVQTVSPAARPSGWTSYAPLAGRPSSAGRVAQKAQAENELVALLGLGGGLPERLVATVAAAWKQRLAQSGRPPARSRAQLQAALHGRVFAVMRGWLGGSGASGRGTRVEMIGERGKPKLIADEDHRVCVELPFGWLVDVWAQGLATVWGRFCLAATTDDGRTWRLTTVAPDFGPPSVATLQLGDLSP